MHCPNCGGLSQSEGGFCIYCGARMPLPTTSIREDDFKRLREQLVPIINHKDRTDVVISSLWVVIPFIGLMIVGIAIFAVLMADVFASVESGAYDSDDPFGIYSTDSMAYSVVLYAISAGLYVALALLTYNLVKRHNEHFTRERRFRDAIMSFSERSAGAMFQYSTPMNAETKRSPILWAGVIALPGVTTLVGMVAMMVIGSADDPNVGAYVLIVLVLATVALVLLVAEFYLFYFLTVEMSNHNNRWMGFVRETKALLGRGGYTAGGLLEPMRLPDRSIAVYVVASLFTGGLFFFYWWYSIVKDGNEHFRHHRHFEGQLVALLSTRPTRTDEQDASISWV